MSKIEEYLSKIQSAIYGKDVRQSIHDAYDFKSTANGHGPYRRKGGSQVCNERHVRAFFLRTKITKEETVNG